jgi:addiction module RelE/StbE family toxin
MAVMQQLSYLAERNPDAAARISIVIDRAVERLASHPALGRSGRIASTRELVIAGTPYIAVYQITSETVTILRLLHEAQRWPD